MNGDDDIFADALALPAVERPAFLLTACRGDDGQRARIEALLRGHERAQGVFNSPLTVRLPVAPEEKTGDRIGRYKLLQKIGEGGMGIVYMAEQSEPVRRRVAVKVIKLGMDTKAVIARFGAEQQALAMMDHPNIAKVFDGGATETGRPYFVMELVRGVPITNYCDEQRLSTPARLDLFVQVAHAIDHAHQKGIIHRDIKPSNILVTLQDGKPVPKVIDFGIAKATQGRLTDATYFTAFEQFIGTPAYMSPEQAEMSGSEIDPRSDIYSLGVLLYELLTGRPPFETKELIQAGLDEMRRQIREVEPPRPSLRLRTLEKDALTTTAQRRHTDAPKLINLIHGDLDWIVMRCLEKDRTRRYESANSVAADLVRHLGNEPVSARPPSAVYRFGKALRRNKPAVAIAAVILIGAFAWVLERRMFALRQSAVRPDAISSLAPVPIDPKSIALLPFVNRSAEKDSDYFSDGMHDAILTSLINIRELRVIPRTSVEGFRKTTKPISQVARELGVAYVLEGTVRRAGGRANISVHLIRAATEEHVWVKEYDRDLTDIFAVQTALSAEIAGLLRLTLSPEEKALIERRPTENLAAYDAYLKAREVHNSANNIRLAAVNRREALYQQAVDLDPNFSVAWGALAFVHAFKVYATIDRSPERLAKAADAMGHALRLAPEAPEVIFAHGNYLYHAHRDYAGATAQFEKALRLQPSNADGYYYLALVQRSQGRQLECLSSLRKSVAVDPLSARNWREVSRQLAAGRRWDEALEAQRRVNTLQADPVVGQAALVHLVYLQTGSTREADDWLAGCSPEQLTSLLRDRKYWAYVKGDYAEWRRLDALPPVSTDGRDAADAAMLLAAQDDGAAARARLVGFPEKVRTDLAGQPENERLWALRSRMEAVLGQKDEALRHARKAAELVSEQRDVFTGTLTSVNLVVVYAWTGDKERAIDELARLLNIPFGIYGGVHAIRADPAYGPLRGEPRFEALLNDPKNKLPLF